MLLLCAFEKLLSYLDFEWERGCKSILFSLLDKEREKEGVSQDLPQRFPARVCEPGTKLPVGLGSPQMGIGLTGSLIYAFLRDMVVLADPLSIALEVDLCGGEGAAAQLHRLVLNDVGVLWLLQEVGQGLGRC